MQLLKVCQQYYHLKFRKPNQIVNSHEAIAYISYVIMKTVDVADANSQYPETLCIWISTMDLVLFLGFTEYDRNEIVHVGTGNYNLQALKAKKSKIFRNRYSLFMFKIKWGWLQYVFFFVFFSRM